MVSAFFLAAALTMAPAPVVTPVAVTTTVSRANVQANKEMQARRNAPIPWFVWPILVTLAVAVAYFKRRVRRALGTDDGFYYD